MKMNTVFCGHRRMFASYPLIFVNDCGTMSVYQWYTKEVCCDRNGTTTVIREGGGRKAECLGRNGQAVATQQGTGGLQTRWHLAGRTGCCRYIPEGEKQPEESEQTDLGITGVLSIATRSVPIVRNSLSTDPVDCYRMPIIDYKDTSRQARKGYAVTIDSHTLFHGREA